MSRRKRRQKQRNMLGLGLVVAGLLALTAFATAGVFLRPPPLDAETLCRTDEPLQTHTIVLVDATDKFERRHRDRLRDVLAQERARLGRYERLTLLHIDARRPREPRVLFSKCLPKPPEQANIFFENPQQIAAQWNEDFADALERALRSASARRVQDASPILTSVRAAASRADFGAAVQHRRLVVVSNFLEHQIDGFSLYVDDASFDVWRQEGASGIADLSGVEVRLSPLDRPDFEILQGNALESFWPEYLDAAHARTVDIDARF